MTRAVIFANGDISDGEFVLPLMCSDDLIVAADGGLSHALALGLRPSLLVGDMDSAPSELVQITRTRGVEIVEHPVRKDKTDLELALDAVQDWGIEEVLVFGALGGRLDHALGNILLAASDRRARMHIKLVESGYELAIVRDSLKVTGQVGDMVSLLALSDTVTGIQSENLEYALHDAQIERGSSLGVSNVMTGTEARVSVGDGVLLAVHVAAET